MPTDERLQQLLKDAFDADVQDVVAGGDLAGTTRKKVVRGRRVRTGVVAGLALSAAVTTVALNRSPDRRDPAAAGSAPVSAPSPGASVSSGPERTKQVQLASFRFRVPASAKVTKSCLPQSAEYLTEPQPLGQLFMLVDAPAESGPGIVSGKCVGATIRFTTHPRPANATLAAPGERTVYLTGSATGTQSGYVALDAHESANAAAAVDGPPGKYYEVFTLPADTSRSVLVAGLRQSRAAG